MTAKIQFLKKPHKIFPTFWPTATFADVGHRLLDNYAPDGLNEYAFIYKPDFPAITSSVMIKPDGIILYDSDDRDKFTTPHTGSWVSNNSAALKHLSALKRECTIVGKTVNYEGNLIFLVYYVIDQAWNVYLDRTSIDAFLLISNNLFGKAQIEIVDPVFNTPIKIDTKRRSFKSRVTLLAKLHNLIGLPLTTSKNRVNNDDTPLQQTSAVHMNFLAHTYKVGVEYGQKTQEQGAESPLLSSDAKPPVKGDD